MKYTYEEIYEYCETNGLLYGLITAMHNNKIGFQAMLVEGEVIIKDNLPVLRIFVYGKEEERKGIDFPLQAASDNAAIKKAIAHPELVKCSVYTFDDYYRATMSCERTQRESRKSLEHQLLLSFLECAKVDTIGKLKAVIRTGEELYRQWEKNKRYIERPKANKQTALLARQYAMDMVRLAKDDKTMPLDDMCRFVNMDPYYK